MAIVNSHEGTKYCFSLQIEMETIVCCKCNMPFMVPEIVKNSFHRNKETFYCPHGHTQWYSKSTLEIEKEKHANEVARLQRDLSNSDFVKQNLERDLKKEKNKLKRVHNGVCPCCNRSFANLHAHMKTKHPELIESVRKKDATVTRKRKKNFLEDDERKIK